MAADRGSSVTLVLIENVAPDEQLAVERRYAAERGTFHGCGTPTRASRLDQRSGSLIHSGDSSVQRDAEAVLLDLLASQLHVAFGPGLRLLPDGKRVELDAISVDPPILVEVWAHQGPPKPAQKHKVMTDALKLIWAQSVLFPDGARKILALADPVAAAHFRGTSWMAAALERFDVEVVVLDLPSDVRTAIRDAQVLQFR